MAKSLLQENDTVRCGNSRDTRRWCRGKEVVEHDKHWVHRFSNWEVQVCKNCGRHFDYRTQSIDLGKELCRIRKERGMTQVQLADAAGMQQEIISELERDSWRYRQSNVKLSTWQRAFEPLGYKLSILMEEVK